MSALSPVILKNSQSQSWVRLIQLSTFAPAHTPRKQIYIVMCHRGNIPWYQQKETQQACHTRSRCCDVYGAPDSQQGSCVLQPQHKHVAKQNKVRPAEATNQTPNCTLRLVHRPAEATNQMPSCTEVSAQACRSHQSNALLYWAWLSSWRRLVH